MSHYLDKIKLLREKKERYPFFVVTEFDGLPRPEHLPAKFRHFCETPFKNLGVRERSLAEVTPFKNLGVRVWQFENEETAKLFNGEYAQYVSGYMPHRLREALSS